MATQNLIVLSYHQFTPEDNPYAFSRTYKQFQNDLNTKDFDWITMDDGHQSIIKACKMMEAKNMRAKIFVSSSLIGMEGYCTWDDLWRLAKCHDIENHSHVHVKLTTLKADEIYTQIKMCNDEIKKHIGRTPRYFVAPWNQYDDRIIKIATHLGLQIVKDRTDIRNDSR
jgi:peptidoglycan/xylan/chitin deacetylase (PgdA/CDA1 family)